MLPIELHVSLEHSLRVGGCIGKSHLLPEKYSPGSSARMELQAELLLQKGLQFFQVNLPIVVFIRHGKFRKWNKTSSVVPKTAGMPQVVEFVPVQNAIAIGIKFFYKPFGKQVRGDVNSCLFLWLQDFVIVGIEIGKLHRIKPAIMIGVDHIQFGLDEGRVIQSRFPLFGINDAVVIVIIFGE